MLCLYICLCTPLVSGAQRGQRGESDPLEMELQMIHSYYVSTEKKSHQGPLQDKCSKPKLSPSPWSNWFLTDAEGVDGERMMSSKCQARTSNPGQKMPPSPTRRTTAWAGTTWCWLSFDRSSYEVATPFVLIIGEPIGPRDTENSKYSCHEAVLLYFICLFVWGQPQLIQNSAWRTGWSTPYNDSLASVSYALGLQL